MTDATESDVPESIPQEEEASCEALTQLDDDTTIGGGDAPSPSPAAEPEDREAEMQPEAHQHEASPEVPAEALQETSPGVQPEGLQHREATRRKPPFCYTRPPVYQHCSGTLGTARVLPLTTLPHAMKVHPRGFRVLSGKSPLERTLGSYFRLPPPPSRQSLKEMTRVKRLLDWRGRSASEVKKPRKLDGFALLEACQVDDPDDATEGVLTDRGFNSVVQEDMEFFSKLEYLDLGENEVALHELTRLNKLEELHLPCCQLSTITLPAGSFTVLSTLNLSFNNFTDPAIVSTLASSLPRLSKLDLSGNNLQTLPPSSTLPFQCLKQLALENNRLKGDAVLSSLSQISSLQEANLNGNQLTRVPQVEASSEGPFLSLQVIGLAANGFSFFEDLFPLTSWGSLKRAVLWGNPLAHRKRDVDILVSELTRVNVRCFLHGPLPPKRKLGEFYTANSKNMIRVADYRKTSLSATHRPVREQDTRPDDDLGEEKPATGEYKSTFFMTEPAAHHAAGALGKPPSIASERLDSREAPGGALKSPWNLPVSHPHTEHAPNDSSNKADWFSINPPDAASESADDPTMPSNWNTVNAELNQLLGSPATLISSPPRGFDASSTAGRSITHNGPQPNLRSAYRELKHALSHPLTNPVAPHLVPRGPTRRKRTTTTTSQHVGSPSAHSNLPPLR